jgi:hypothetical protein
VRVPLLGEDLVAHLEERPAPEARVVGQTRLGHEDAVVPEASLFWISEAVFFRSNSPKNSSMYWISRAPFSRILLPMW